MKKVVVKQDPENEVPAEIMAKAIVDIGGAITRLRRSGLSDRAIVLLIHDASGVGKPTVRAVLDGMAALERLYLVPKS